MRIAFRFWYYKAVTPGMWIADLTDEQWKTFRLKKRAYDRKVYIQKLFDLDYLDVRELWWIPLDHQSSLTVKTKKILCKP